MDGTISNITVEQLREMIDLVCPCTDDYLYLYDLKNDYYYISPHAMERFCIPNYEFHDVSKNHEKFVYPEDLEMLQNDLDMMVKGEKNFHNLQYRWLGVDKSPVWINCRGRSIMMNGAIHPLCWGVSMRSVKSKRQITTVVYWLNPACGCIYRR